MIAMKRRWAKPKNGAEDRGGRGVTPKQKKIDCRFGQKGFFISMRGCAASGLTGYLGESRTRSVFVERIFIWPHVKKKEQMEEKKEHWRMKSICRMFQLSGFQIKIKGSSLWPLWANQKTSQQSNGTTTTRSNSLESPAPSPRFCSLFCSPSFVPFLTR